MNTMKQAHMAFIKIAGVSGMCIGGYNGYGIAKGNFTPKKDLSVIEHFGEGMCFTLVMTSLIFIGTFGGVLYGIFAPITIPGTIACMVKDDIIPLPHQFYGGNQIVDEIESMVEEER